MVKAETSARHRPSGGVGLYRRIRGALKRTAPVVKSVVTAAADVQPHPKDLTQSKHVSELVEHGLQCPLTLAPALNPVTPGDGYVYEMSALVECMRHQKEAGQSLVSPMTREPLSGHIFELKCLTDASRAMAMQTGDTDTKNDVLRQLRIEESCRNALKKDKENDTATGYWFTEGFVRRAQRHDKTERTLRLSTLWRLTNKRTSTLERSWNALVEEIM